MWRRGQELRRLRGTRISTSIITVAELYDGAFKSANPQANLMNIRQFLSAYPRLPMDDAVAETFAEVRSTLRRQGMLISD